MRCDCSHSRRTRSRREASRHAVQSAAQGGRDSPFILILGHSPPNTNYTRRRRAYPADAPAVLRHRDPRNCRLLSVVPVAPARRSGMASRASGARADGIPLAADTSPGRGGTDVRGLRRGICGRGHRVAMESRRNSSRSFGPDWQCGCARGNGADHVREPKLQDITKDGAAAGIWIGEDETRPRGASMEIRRSAGPDIEAGGGTIDRQVTIRPALRASSK